MLARAGIRSRQAVCIARCEVASKIRSTRLTRGKREYALPTLFNQAHRHSSSTSSTRWKARQTRDTYARDAKVDGLKSRAAYKLLEINDKYRLFKPGDTVVDLGYAPGSWSQVAVNRTKPGGRVVGIDVIPTQPPKGVSTLQGDFLSAAMREEVRKFVADPMRGRPRARKEFGSQTEEELAEDGRSLAERNEMVAESAVGKKTRSNGDDKTQTLSQRQLDESEGRLVNVVLSDMCEPWPLMQSTWIRSVSNPYRRMMNTSGMAFRDHAGSMVC